MKIEEGDIILFSAIAGHPVHGKEQEFIGRVMKDAKGLYAANYYQFAWKEPRVIESATRTADAGKVDGLNALIEMRRDLLNGLKTAMYIAPDDPYVKIAIERVDAQFNAVRAALEARTADAGKAGRKLWLWKNGEREYWAFDNLYPCESPNGDPLIIGEPVGYAIYKQSCQASGKPNEPHPAPSTDVGECPLGDECDLTIAYMKGVQDERDRHARKARVTRIIVNPLYGVLQSLNGQFVRGFSGHGAYFSGEEQKKNIRA